MPNSTTQRSPVKLAYIMSKFPKITESFILYEIVELKRRGFSVDIFPLLKTSETVVHPEVEPLMQHVHYRRSLSAPVLRANIYFLLTRPLAYMKALLEVLIHTFGCWHFFSRGLAAFPKSVCFAYEMQQLNISHVHAHFSNHPTVAALIVHRLTGIPFSFTAHGSDMHRDQRMLDRKIDASKFAVMVSEYNRQLLCDRFDRDFDGKMQVIRCGVDPDECTPSAPSQPDSIIRILCIAALRNVKGHTFLLEACALLMRETVSFELHLVGNGPLRHEIEDQIATLGLGDVVVMHGALARPEVLALLGQADVVALTSVMDSEGRREGVPVCLMEAMAFGLPVVSSQLSGIPELVDSGVTGILAPPRDAAAIAEALKTLCRDPDLRVSMGAAGRDKVLTEFNLKHNVETLAQTMTASY
jgi:colanic acid/amylovoran biosynthesis glycosyltransferase